MNCSMLNSSDGDGCYVLPNLATIGIKSSPKNTVF